MAFGKNKDKDAAMTPSQRAEEEQMQFMAQIQQQASYDESENAVEIENTKKEEVSEQNQNTETEVKKRKRKKKRRRRSSSYSYGYGYGYNYSYGYGYGYGGYGNSSDNSKFAIVESYKAGRTNIMFSLSASDKKCFAITSFSKGEGKSTVASNLAISFSKMEKKILLVDCDLRRPNVHNIFKLDNSNGLSNIIGKMVEYDDTVHKNVLENLDIITSGTIPPNPSELMCSSTFVNLMKKLQEEYDYIIFDTPPIGVVTDALLLKDLIAGYVLIVRERSTTHKDLVKLLDGVKMADSKVLGIIEVGCTGGKKRGKKKYYYYYQYY
ncbi:MAG: CpsD/CapB family tyrosine-protein kinase [Ruminococcus sp.]|nr:CpsD/CapB family tyrosine-protein kinase [Ruminococcus sp.]